MITASFVSDKTQFTLTEQEVWHLKIAVIDGLAFCMERLEKDQDVIWDDSIKACTKLLEKFGKL